MERNFTKYDYPQLPRDDSTGTRLYKTPDNKLVPSVTTILSKTKDMSGLKAWQARVGKDEANRIRNEAARVGTSMHLTLECHIEEKERKFDFSPIHSQASQMANVIVKEGLKYVTEVWGSEVKLYYEDQYAGTTDVVGMYKGVPHIIDFKQTNKPKQEKWIQDYYLQLTAYAHAHNYMTGTDIKNGVVLMCCRDLSFQKFELNEIKFEKYSYMWFNRVKEYQKIITEAADS
jgi:genome maintenance exonuclease 1